MARTKKNARTSDTDEDDCLPFSRSVKKKKKKPTTTIQPRGPSKISSSPKDSVGSTKVSQGPPARGPRKPQKSSKDKSDSEDDLPPIQRKSLPRSLNDLMKPRRPISHSRSPKPKKHRPSNSSGSNYAESGSEVSRSFTPTMTSIRNSRRGSRHLGDLETQSPLSKNQLEHQYFFSKDLPPDQHFKSQKPRLIDDFSELNPEDYDNLSYPVEVRCLVKKGTYLEIDNADDLRTHVDKWAKKMLKTGTDGGRVAKGQDRVKIQKHGKDIKPNLANPILGKRTSLVSTTESAPSLSVTSESLLEGDLPTSYPGIDSQTLLLSDRRTPVDIRALLDGQVRKLDKMMNSITAVAAKQNGKGRDSNNLQQLKDRFLRTVRRAQKTYERGLDDLGVMPKKSALNTGQEASTKTRDKMDTSKSGSKVIDLTVGYVDSEAEG